MNGQYNIGDVVLRNWTLVRLIGEGSFGKVFEAKRVDFGEEYSAAIKIIPVPKKKEDANEFFSQGMTQETVSEYYQSVVEELSREFSLMSKLKGNSNIVSYEDHEVVPHSDGIGRDIFIRMELLTPFSVRMKSPEFQITRQEIIRFGIDICKALELCQKHNIIHRDIKPDNIFLSSMGDYKLGDFGVSRIMDKTTGGSSKTGTPNYMAPEVYRGEHYGSSVDIYSLGIVLYQLLNKKRLPFFPKDPMPITYQDRVKAFDTRMGGKTPIPFPVDDSGRLGEIVLKACEYHAQDRYSSSTEMREDLEALLYDKKTSDEPKANKDATVIKGYSKNFNSGRIQTEAEHGESHTKSSPSDDTLKTEGIVIAPPKRRIKWAIPAIAVALLAVVFFLIRKPWEQKNEKPVWETDIPITAYSPTPSSIPSAVPCSTPSLAPGSTTGMVPSITPIPSPTLNHGSESDLRVPDATSPVKIIPKFVSINLNEDNKPVLTWNAIDRAEYYSIYRSEDQKKYENLNINTSETTYTVRSCKEGKTYYFKIKAKLNDGSSSEYSDVLPITIPGTLMHPVSSTPGLSTTWIDTALNNQKSSSLYEEGCRLLYEVQDYDKAFEILERAVNEGHSGAMAALGEMYYYGYGIEKNYDKALELYTQSAALGDPQGMQNLGDYYSAGLACDPDYERSFSLYTDAASYIGRPWSAEGYPWSYFHLGELYLYGLGTDRDPQKAAELFARAAEKGIPYAMLYLADMYANGEGVQRDYSVAKEWYQKAAMNGLQEAVSKLEQLEKPEEMSAVSLRPTPSPTPSPTPTPSPPRAATPTPGSDAYDYAHAVSLLEAGKYEEAEIAFEFLGDYKDSAEKLAETQYYIGLGYETGNIGMKNDALAASYYQLSANGGHPAGINKLGECYYNGAGKTQDYNKAFELFEEASDLGCVEADYNLGLCYENGHGVKQNKALAEAYFNIASKNVTGNS